MLVQQDAVGNRKYPSDSLLSTQVPHATHKIRVNQRVPHDGRQFDVSPAHRHVFANGLAEHRIGHELMRPLLVLVRAEDTVCVAQIGELQTQLRRFEFERFQRWRQWAHPAQNSSNAPRGRARHALDLKSAYEHDLPLPCVRVAGFLTLLAYPPGSLYGTSCT